MGESTASTWRSTYDSHEQSMITPEATHIRHPVASCRPLSVAGLIKPRHPTFQFGTGRGVALQHQGIMAGNYMVARTGQFIGPAIALQRFGDAVYHREWAALLHVGVEMRRVRRQHHLAAPCSHPN